MKSLLLFSIVLLSATAFSQELKTTEHRVEINLKDNRYKETAHTMGKHGLVVKSLSKTAGVKGDFYLHHDVYDLDMKRTHSDSIKQDTPNPFVATFEGEQNIYYLAYHRNLPTYIYAFDMNTGETKRIVFDLIGIKGIKQIYSFHVVGQKAYAILEEIGKVSLLLFDLDKGAATITPITIEGITKDKAAPMNLQYLEAAEKFYLSLRVYVSKEEIVTYLLSIDLEGKLSKPEMINGMGDKIINSISVGAVGSNEVAVAGTYCSKLGGPDTGVFFGGSSNGAFTKIKTYNFIDIPNYFSLLSEKRQEQIKNKGEKKASEGKEFEIKKTLVIHDVISVDNEFLFIAESVQPITSFETKTTTVNGRTTTERVEVLDGYYYSNAMITKFNAEGEIIWNQSFDISLSTDFKIPRTLIHVATNEQKNIQLVYSYGYQIFAKAYSFDGEIVHDKKSNPIIAPDESEKVSVYFSNISYWYDNYFLSFGNEKITNKEDRQDKRKVLFMNKISFE